MGTTTIAGTQLEVRHIAGNGSAASRAPLVFLHEGLGSVAMWRDWPRLLCERSGREGWVYSRRGYGESEAVCDVRGPSTSVGGVRNGRLLPDYMHHEAWSVLPQLLTACGIRTPILVGHSDGARLPCCMAAAIRSPPAS